MYGIACGCVCFFPCLSPVTSLCYVSACMLSINEGWIFGVATEKFKEIEKNASDYAGTSCNAPSLKASAPATVAEKKRVRMTSKCSKDIQKGRFVVWYTANYNNEICYIVTLSCFYEYIKNITYLFIAFIKCNRIRFEFNLNNFLYQIIKIC